MSAKQTSAMFCGHANEAPSQCPCESNCYCKSHTCAKKTSNKVSNTYNMEKTFSETNKAIQELSDKKLELLKGLTTGVIISFPDWDVVSGENVRKGSSDLKLRHLIFVNDLGGEEGKEKVTFLNVDGKPAKIAHQTHSAIPKEYAFYIIDNFNGKVYPNTILNILTKFGGT